MLDHTGQQPSRDNMVRLPKLILKNDVHHLVAELEGPNTGQGEAAFLGHVEPAKETLDSRVDHAEGEPGLGNYHDSHRGIDAKLRRREAKAFMQGTRFEETERKLLASRRPRQRERLNQMQTGRLRGHELRLGSF